RRSVLQIGEHRKLIHQHARRITDRLFRIDRTVGLDIDDQTVEVGTLLDTGTLNQIADAAHRAERCVEDDATDRLAFRVLRTSIARYITPPFLDLDLHVDLAAGGEVRDHMLGIDDLDVVADLDVTGGDHTLARL